MSCEECRELKTHRFRDETDLVNAIRLAAEEVDRGVLAPVVTRVRTLNEDVAIDSALQAGAVPDAVLYRFKCNLCGDQFALTGDTDKGSGEWIRNDERNPDPVPGRVTRK
jgi:hypothetical protein